jgi:hypothetical protein
MVSQLPTHSTAKTSESLIVWLVSNAEEEE